jgi:hypothetical protein
VRFSLALILAALVMMGGTASGAQEAGQQSEPPYQMFSGNVVDFSKDKLTVERTLPGKEAEFRSFLITAETKVEGKLRTKVRVTVGFMTKDEGEVAMRIIVRPAGSSGSPKKK